MRFIPARAGNARRTLALHQIVRRFIPARAGNAQPSNGSIGLLGGSSPRVRGTPELCPLPRCVSAVHPRACGERTIRAGSGVTCGGSSPRVRGTRASSPSAQPIDRFIPARAGNAVSCTVDGNVPSRFIPARAGNAILHSRHRRGMRPVHPRACGERSHHAIGTWLGCRFIPARAGNA